VASETVLVPESGQGLALSSRLLVYKLRSERPEVGLGHQPARRKEVCGVAISET
jgi:hypothetical protein